MGAGGERTKRDWLEKVRKTCILKCKGRMFFGSKVGLTVSHYHLEPWPMAIVMTCWRPSPKDAD